MNEQGESMNKKMNSGMTMNQGGSIYRWALGVSMAIMASLSAPNANANANGRRVTVRDVFVDTTVTFQLIDNISRSDISGSASSSSQAKGKVYSNNLGVMSSSETLRLGQVIAQSLPDHCVTLAARAIGSENVLFSVTARIYTVKDGKDVPQPMVAMRFTGEIPERIGAVVGCSLSSNIVRPAEVIAE